MSGRAGAGVPGNGIHHGPSHHRITGTHLRACGDNPVRDQHARSTNLPQDGTRISQPSSASLPEDLQALNDEVILEFNESPLSEVVDFLKNANDIPIIIDRRALDETGMASDTPVTVSFAGISLRSGLARMLGELDLDYFIQNEVLVITSREAARAQLDPRIYKIDGLKIAEDKLIEIITSMVAPDTWTKWAARGRSPASATTRSAW